MGFLSLKSLPAQQCVAGGAIGMSSGAVQAQAPVRTGLTEILVYDDRLKGDRPTAGSTPVIEVDGHTPLAILVMHLKASSQDKWIKRLKIHCHGYPGALQLCREHLDIDTVRVLAPLHGRFTNAGMIELYACSVAAPGKSRHSMLGDGDMFCKALARTCRAWVKASSAVQTYHMGRMWPGPLRFGDWEGKVHIYDPRGNAVQ